jgi:hypothetical protein
MILAKRESCGVEEPAVCRRETEPALSGAEGAGTVQPVLWVVMPSGLHRTYGSAVS